MQLAYPVVAKEDRDLVDKKGQIKPPEMLLNEPAAYIRKDLLKPGKALVLPFSSSFAKTPAAQMSSPLRKTTTITRNYNYASRSGCYSISVRIFQVLGFHGSRHLLRGPLTGSRKYSWGNRFGVWWIFGSWPILYTVRLFLTRPLTAIERKRCWPR